MLVVIPTVLAAVAGASWSLVTALRDMLGLIRAPGRASLDEMVIALSAASALVLLLWVSVGLLVAVIAALPGPLGALSRRMRDAMTPEAVRRWAAVLLGVAVVSTFAPGGAAASEVRSVRAFDADLASSAPVPLWVAPAPEWTGPVTAPTDTAAATTPPTTAAPSPQTTATTTPRTTGARSPAPATATTPASATEATTEAARPASAATPPATATARPSGTLTAPAIATAPPRGTLTAPATATAPSAPIPTPMWTPPPTRALPPVTLTAPRPAAEDQAEVTVRRGDTLWDLAAAYLAPEATDAEIAAEWQRWYAANRPVIGPDPDLLLPGQVLAVPAPADAAPGDAAPADAASTGGLR